jgi:hypothetical protein
MSTDVNLDPWACFARCAPEADATCQVDQSTSNGRLIMHDDDSANTAYTLEQRKTDRSQAPLRPSHVWSIRAKLQIAERTRDLALLNLAIDSKLRSCDVVAVRVDDVAPNGYTLDRGTVRQKKTGRRLDSNLPSRRGRPSTSTSRRLRESPGPKRR